MSHPSLSWGDGNCVPGTLGQVDSLSSLLKGTTALGWGHHRYDNRQERNVSPIPGPGVLVSSVVKAYACKDMGVCTKTPEVTRAGISRYTTHTPNV